MKVPVFRQPKDSFLCGLYCAKMIYHYHGKKLSTEDVLRGIGVYKRGVFASNIGIGFIKNGFDVTLVQLKTRMFPPSYRKMSNKDILEDMKKRVRNKDRFSKELRWNIKFIESGGKVEHRIVKMDEIKKAIDEGNPPMVVIDSRVLYGDKPGSAGHYVVPVRMTRDSVTINDPYHGEARTYPLSDFIFAFYVFEGMVLFIKPKK